MRRATLLLYALLVACHRGGASTAEDQEPDEQATMAAEHAMAGTVSNEDLHLRLMPLRPAAPGDSARAAQVLDVMRRELAKYRDVRVAEAGAADGSLSLVGGRSVEWAPPLASLDGFADAR